MFSHDQSSSSTLLNLVDVGIIIHDVDTGRILEINDRICEMHGGTRDQILGRELKDLMDVAPPYSQVEALEKIHRLHREGPQTFEWLARAADGHLFWINVKLQLAILEFGLEPRANCRLS